MKRFAQIVVLLMLGALVLAGPAVSQVEEAWVARYDGPAGKRDEAAAIALDAQGNVYVTGFLIDATPEYCTLKYGPDGNQLWVARYDGPMGVDKATAMVIDVDANVYVTGSSAGGPTRDDYATVKYDTDGNEVWVRRYNSPSNGQDDPSAIALDGEGNVYVTGRSSNDYATVKYDADGNELWVRRYNGPSNGIDSPFAIALDAEGNVYVTGRSDGSPLSDYCTVKYDTDGNELWVRRHDGPRGAYDVANAIAVDPQGNVYVTGEERARMTVLSPSYATLKYDTDGNELWVARYIGPGYDQAFAIAVDDDGNAYVSGKSGDGNDQYDIATVKYDTDGNELWVRRYGCPGASDGWAEAIALDGEGNVYVTGECGDDYATLKYHADGSELWAIHYDGPAGGRDTAYAIAIDASRNVYVTGGSDGGSTFGDSATVKYVQPDINVQPREFDFGDIVTGHSSALRAEIRNIGSVTHEVTGTFLDEGTSDAFAITADPTGAQIEPGEATQVEVTFAPTAEGAHEGTLVIASTDPGQAEVRVSLAGTCVPEPAPAIEVAPGSLEFGEVHVGMELTREVTITNAGTAPLVISDIDFHGGSSPDFLISELPPDGEIPVGESVFVGVTYRPAGEGGALGVLIVSSNDPVRPELSVSLAGTGLLLPQVEVSTSLLEFGEVAVGSESSQEVVITNNGPGALEISDVGLQAGSSDGYLISQMPPDGEIETGASVTVELTYRPTVEGDASGMLVIGCNDPYQPEVEVALSGRGVVLGGRFVRGDADGSGRLQLSDVIAALLYIFMTPRPEVDCAKALDFDDTGKVNLSDVIALLVRIFAGGGDPPLPYPECGVDRTDDGLPCENDTDFCTGPG